VKRARAALQAAKSCTIFEGKPRHSFGEEYTLNPELDPADAGDVERFLLALAFAQS
jgi:hypothetical protein